MYSSNKIVVFNVFFPKLPKSGNHYREPIGDNTAAIREEALTLADIITKNHKEMETAIAKVEANPKNGSQVMTHKFVQISEPLRSVVDVGGSVITHDGCGDGSTTNHHWRQCLHEISSSKLLHA